MDKKPIAFEMIHAKHRTVLDVALHLGMSVKGASLGSSTSKETVLSVDILVVNVNMKLTEFTMVKSNLSYKI